MTVAAPPPVQALRRAVHRALVAVIGGALVLLGLVLVPLPGPGWLVVAAGTAVLGSEFAWAAGPARRVQTVLSGSVRLASRVRGGRVLLVLVTVVSSVLPLALL